MSSNCNSIVHKRQHFNYSKGVGEKRILREDTQVKAVTSILKFLITIFSISHYDTR